MSSVKKPEPSEHQLAFGGQDAGVLERFMQEFFPFNEFKKIGFFKKEMKNNYYKQAEKVCTFFGYKSVFEYGAKEHRAHLSYVSGNRAENEEFVTVIPSIYD